MGPAVYVIKETNAYISLYSLNFMVFISKQLPITIIINDVSHKHADKLNQCFCYCCLAKKTMTMKVHELRHIALFVKAFGPLWVFSCLPYENANGI